MKMQFVYVALGGVIGAVLRYGAYVLSAELVGSNHGFLVTAFVNVLGSFLLGMVLGYSQHWILDPRLSLLLTIGLLGSFTTFSTFAIEAVQLLSAGKPGLAALFVLGSTVLSILAAWGGLSLFKSVTV